MPSSCPVCDAAVQSETPELCFSCKDSLSQDMASDTVTLTQESATSSISNQSCPVCSPQSTSKNSSSKICYDCQACFTEEDEETHSCVKSQEDVVFVQEKSFGDVIQEVFDDAVAAGKVIDLVLDDEHTEPLANQSDEVTFLRTQPAANCPAATDEQKKSAAR